jgi:splicing factor 3A subunit 1
MAPSATDQNEALAALDDVVSKPPPGVVLPPKDIRAIVEKTAGYVARNGEAFEERIRQNELNNPKFSFLALHDAYYGFYRWRLEEVRSGRGTAVSAGRVGEQQARKEAEKPKGPDPPPEYHFSAKMPNISASDLDVVKLTAQFVAKNGRSFATTLSQREASKSQFDFLRPQHSLHGYYSRLVDQYTALINGAILNGGKAQKDRVADLEKTVKNKYRVLESAKKRSEWVQFQESEKVKKEEKEDAEKRAFAEIDWHDFVIVETVLFTPEDDHVELPPPTSLSDLQSASLEQKADMSLAPNRLRIEEAMPGADDYITQPSVPMPPSYPHNLPPPPPPPPPPPAS